MSKALASQLENCGGLYGCRVNTEIGRYMEEYWNPELLSKMAQFSSYKWLKHGRAGICSGATMFYLARQYLKWAHRLPEEYEDATPDRVLYPWSTVSTGHGYKGIFELQDLFVSAYEEWNKNLSGDLSALREGMHGAMQRSMDKLIKSEDLWDYLMGKDWRSKLHGSLSHYQLMEVSFGVTDLNDPENMKRAMIGLGEDVDSPVLAAVVGPMHCVGIMAGKSSWRKRREAFASPYRFFDINAGVLRSNEPAPFWTAVGQYWRCPDFIKSWGTLQSATFVAWQCVKNDVTF